MPDEHSFPESAIETQILGLQIRSCPVFRDRTSLLVAIARRFGRTEMKPTSGSTSLAAHVHDLERSIRFFVDQLGFRLLRDVRFASGYRWVEITPPDGTASLTLVLPGREKDDERFVGQLGVVTFLTEDVEAKYHEWSKRGVRFTLPLQRPAFGAVFCRFEDPDGNTFLLMGV